MKNLDESDIRTTPPSTIQDEMDWWFDSPGLKLLGRLLLIAAAVAFALRMASLWPPGIREVASTLVAGAIGAVGAWFIVPVVGRLNGPRIPFLPTVGEIIWLLSQLGLMALVGQSTGRSLAVVVGFFAGLLARGATGAFSPPGGAQPVMVSTAAGARPIFASRQWILFWLAALSVAEFVALAWFLQGGQRTAAMVWVWIAVAAPPLLGIMLRSLIWPVFVLVPGLICAAVLGLWPDLPLGPNILSGSSDRFAEILLPGNALVFTLAGAILSAPAVVISRIVYIMWKERHA